MVLVESWSHLQQQTAPNNSSPAKPTIMSEYHKALKVLMQSPVTDDMIKFLTNQTLRVLPNVQTPAQTSAYPSPPSSPPKKHLQPQRLPSLMSFISRLVRHTNVYTSTLLTTVCYLNKLKCILPRDATGLPSTIHRIFLACLVLSAKFHNDSSPLNRHWAKYTDGLFSLEDLNLMERQLIQLLNWDLRVTNDDLILDLRFLLEPIVADIEKTSRQRKRIEKQKLLQQQRHRMIESAGTVRSLSNSSSTTKLYDHQRNVSICSDLSSSTLVDYDLNANTTPKPAANTKKACRNSWEALEHELNQVLMQHDTCSDTYNACNY